jgi:hypothetical protein
LSDEERLEMKIELDTTQRERLLDLLREQLWETLGGTRTGYGQPKSDEVADIEELIEELEG